MSGRPRQATGAHVELETAFAVIAGVLVVSALAAGLVERAPLSFPMLFLGLGFLIGDRGLELISIGLDNDVLEVVAVVALALVLFLDAAAGFVVGAAGSWTMGLVDQRFRIRREYQSLYGIGLVPGCLCRR